VLFQDLYAPFISAEQVPKPKLKGKPVIVGGEPSADMGLKCLKCQRRVLLERGVFGRRVKEFVSRSD
jgi:hypothetical protein